MKYKKNLDEVIKRNKKLWSGDFTNKVLAKIDIESFKTFDMWSEALSLKYCPDYKKMFEVFVDDFKKREFLLDDAMPTARPNIGDFAFGAYLGAEVIFGEGGGFSKPFLNDLKDFKQLKFNPDNYWVKHLIKATKYFEEKSEGLCATSIIETSDSLNLGVNIYGSKIFIELYDNPEMLLEFFDFAMNFTIKLVLEQRKYIKKFDGGYFDLHEEWLPDDCIWLSIDSWGGCSPEMFKKMGKYHLQKIIDFFGCGWLHMHNSHLHLLEEVVTVKNLLGIGILDDPKESKCFPKLREIQKITKNIPLQINCNKKEFLENMKNNKLPRNIMYWIDSGVKSVEEANKIMEMVYDY